MVLISAILLITLLCGCRTRISNNTNVGRRLTDVDGTVQELYETRRDELGIPVAEAPLFPSKGSDEEYEGNEDYDEEDEEFEEDEEADEEDEELEEEEDEEESGNTVSTTTPISRPSQSVVVRPSTPQTQTNTYIRVTLNPNGKNATCSSSAVSVRKGSAYGSLPTPTRPDYEFKGWYTGKSKGSKITPTTTVSKGKDHTLYAHWKEIEKKTYTITFDGNGEEDEVSLSSSEITVKEGGKYGKLPSAKREKYAFTGWFTDASEGSQITKDTKFTGTEDQTLYAHWDYDPYKWWNDEFKTAANEIDDDSVTECIVDDSNDKADEFLKDCKARTADEDKTPTTIIKFVKNFDEDKAAQEAETLREKYSETAPDAKIIIVTNNAIYGSKEEKLLYKMIMFDVLHGSGYNIDEAEFDLLGEGGSANYPYVD